jgi:3' exoribonuclease, RNase T-like
VDRATIEKVMAANASNNPTRAAVRNPSAAERAGADADRYRGEPAGGQNSAMAYRYFYDCEFIEDGRTIDLVSIGVVDGHGREYYAISTEFDPSGAIPWVRRHVLDRLPSPGDPAWRPRARIRSEVLSFLTEPLRPAEEIELWAWYAAYDHVVLAQLFGRMTELPRAIPRFTKDLRQLWDDVGRPPLPAGSNRHDALADARHNLARWQVMAGLSRPPARP